jgi:RIO-like serine/threonine protein kinase
MQHAMESDYGLACLQTVWNIVRQHEFVPLQLICNHLHALLADGAVAAFHIRRILDSQELSAP